MSALSTFQGSIDLQALTETQKQMLVELRVISFLLIEGLNLKLDSENVRSDFSKEK